MIWADDKGIHTTAHFFRRAIVAALTGIFSAAALAQTVIVNDLVSSSSNPVQNWSGLTMVGQSFTATASGNITSITLDLTTSNSSASPVYSVAVWSGTSSGTAKPSAALATLVSNQNWNVVYSATQNPASTITFNASGFTQNYDLVSGTTYWIVITSTSGSAKAWGVSDTNIGDTATFNGSWSNVTLTGSLGMSIAVQSAIPEPGFYALLAGALTLGGAIVVRRRQQAGAGGGTT